MRKAPELLLPAGTFESFNAAVKAGADAIYIGLKQFSPKFEGINFSLEEVAALQAFCNEHKIKLLVTLNSVVKNSELPDLYKVLHSLYQIKPFALIIQDLGILNIIKTDFPDFRIHASTQMAFHNSLDLQYAAKFGFSRIVLARELKRKEIQAIASLATIETEVFIQGALCYSFAGVCLFSSYLGGSGANRNKCTQPCKKDFIVEGKRQYPFSLKENFQIENISLLLKSEIDAFKVEGRTKTALYVYRIGRAYRKILDGDIREGQRELKQLRACTESTSWFLGDELEDAFSQQHLADNYVGRVLKQKWRSVLIYCRVPLEFGDRLRIQTDDGKSLHVKVKEVKKQEGCRYELTIYNSKLPPRGRIFLEGRIIDGFLSNVPQEYYNKIRLEQKRYDKDKVLRRFVEKSPEQATENSLFLRIDSVAWFQKLDFTNWDYLILSFSFADLKNLSVEQLPIDKIIVEIPVFVPEDMIENWTAVCSELFEKGIQRFMVSQISQKGMLPDDAFVYTNENIYVFNDASTAFVKANGFKGFVFPFENDFENIRSSAHVDGIVPVFFHPKLFYSRMPVKNISESGIGFKDGKGDVYRKRIKDGITIIYPERPVSLVHWRERLILKGFRNFLFDYSGVRASGFLSPKVLNKFYKSEPLANAGTFNFEKGLD